MLKEKRMNKEKLGNGLLIKVYKLTNNKNGLEYRFIVREKRFGKIIHDKMFFTKEGVEKFIENLKCDFNFVFPDEECKNHIDMMLNLKNAINDFDRDLVMERNGYPVYTGGCEGLIMKHKTSGVRVINYDFLDKIRYDEKEMPVIDKNEEDCFTAFMNDYTAIDDYHREFGINPNELKHMIKNGFNNINYKDIDNVIVRFKHNLYRH